MVPHRTQAVRVTSRQDQAETALRDVLGGARGGRNRRRILHALAERPRNANRLAEALGLDYKTVRHHLSVLAEADAVSRGGSNYGAVYVPTPRVRRHWDVVEELTDAA
ncbi:helix-turn-helix domain-containing protein [Salinigranum halophilum]|uniref:helix-turn-helix domain-containing protein n=1 Tax=Salinigranum halophilum TaxID=2565931 RepID=UPI0010A75FFB|nr:helix-turn-helix domain-containing protein [Salinigranum halophilum]